MECFVRAVVLSGVDGVASGMMVLRAGEIVSDDVARDMRALVCRLRGVRDAMQNARHGIDERREHCDQAQQEPWDGSARHEVSIT